MNIVELFGKQKAYTFAKISKLVYEENPSFYGFQSRKISIDNNVVFILYNDNDIVVASRGTELSDLGDIKTDACIRLVPSLTGTGKGHKGFEDAVLDVWEHVMLTISSVNKGQNMWFTGHSLGAAMSHIMAVLYKKEYPDAKVMLYTFGSPRVGNKQNTLLGSVEHHRYVDSADVVPRIPFVRYYHFGTLHYLNKDGKEINANWGVIVRDRILCFFNNPTNFIADHFIDRYVDLLGRAEV